MQLQETTDGAVSSLETAQSYFAYSSCPGIQINQEWDVCSVQLCLFVLLQMELESAGPSVPSVIHDENGNVIDSRDPSGEPIQFVFEEITWQQEIPWEEAAQKLEVAMYPFKKVRKRDQALPWHVYLGQVVFTAMSSHLEDQQKPEATA